MTDLTSETIAYGRLIPVEPTVAPAGMVRAWSEYLRRVPEDPQAAQLRAAIQPYLGQVRGTRGGAGNQR